MRRVGTPVRTLHPFVQRFVADIERLVPAVLRTPIGKRIAAHRDPRFPSVSTLAPGRGALSGWEEEGVRGGGGAVLWVGGFERM